jgi:hypothetical protein
MMSLDDELAALLATLGVVLEEPGEDERATARPQRRHRERESQARYAFGMDAEALAADEDEEEGDAAIAAVAALSLFQTSREHYGVFYRVDLTQGVPHLRIYMPEDEGTLKMRCYLVRAAHNTPLHEWFLTARAHEGSPAFEEARDSAQQHLLFAAGELMKRLFWSGDVDTMQFPLEIAVVRIA